MFGLPPPGNFIYPAEGKIVAIFNHKGGVGKTTTTAALGWELARKGLDVLLIDADPQCNLTGFLVNPGFELAEYKFGDDLDNDPLQMFYERHPRANIRASLAPKLGDAQLALELDIVGNNPNALITDVFQVRERINFLPEQRRDSFRQNVPQPPDGLYLLGGHMSFHEYEKVINTALSNPEGLPNARDYPGCFHALFRQLQRSHYSTHGKPFDVILIDLSPGISILNKLIIMSSKGLFLPSAMDYYSMMAFQSLSKILPRWDDELTLHPLLLQTVRSQASEDFRFPTFCNKPVFLGHSFHIFTVNREQPTKAFEKWRKIINSQLPQFIGMLDSRGMTLPLQTFMADNNTYKERGTFRNYQGLAPMCSTLHVPITVLAEQDCTLTFARGYKINEHERESIVMPVCQQFDQLVLLLTDDWNVNDPTILQHQQDADVIRSVPAVWNYLVQINQQFNVNAVHDSAVNVRNFLFQNVHNN